MAINTVSAACCHTLLDRQHCPQRTYHGVFSWAKKPYEDIILMKGLRRSELRTGSRQTEVERQASYTGKYWTAGGSVRDKQSYGSCVEDYRILETRDMNTQ
jgi:hypothetical protein